MSRGRKEKERKGLADERMDRKDVRKEYKRKVDERLREAKMMIAKEPSKNEVFGVFQEVLLGVAALVVGYRQIMDMRKEIARWTDEMCEIVKWKRRAHKTMLQRKVIAEIRVRLIIKSGIRK